MLSRCTNVQEEKGSLQPCYQPLHLTNGKLQQITIEYVLAAEWTPDMHVMPLNQQYQHKQREEATTKPQNVNACRSQVTTPLHKRHQAVCGKAPRNC